MDVDANVNDMEEDWTCGSCGQICDGDWEYCVICSTPKDGDAKQEDGDAKQDQEMVDNLDLVIRNSWKVGSAVEIYSKSGGNQWIQGEVISDFTDKLGEALMIGYNVSDDWRYRRYEKFKEVDRFDADLIRPLSIDNGVNSISLSGTEKKENYDTDIGNLTWNSIGKEDCSKRVNIMVQKWCREAEVEWNDQLIDVEVWQQSSYSGILLEIINQVGYAYLIKHKLEIAPVDYEKKFWNDVHSDSAFIIICSDRAEIKKDDTTCIEQNRPTHRNVTIDMQYIDLIIQETNNKDYYYFYLDSWIGEGDSWRDGGFYDGGNPPDIEFGGPVVITVYSDENQLVYKQQFNNCIFSNNKKYQGDATYTASYLNKIKLKHGKEEFGGPAIEIQIKKGYTVNVELPRVTPLWFASIYAEQALAIKRGRWNEYDNKNDLQSTKELVNILNNNQ